MKLTLEKENLVNTKIYFLNLNMIQLEISLRSEFGMLNNVIEKIEEILRKPYKNYHNKKLVAYIESRP